MKLDDLTLLRCAKQHIDNAFPSHIFGQKNANICRNSVVECLGSALTYFEDESLAPHSLFRYQALCERKKTKNSLKTLWQQLNNCAIFLLRWHDRRDNVARRVDHYVRVEDTSELSKYFFKVTDFEKILYGTDVWYRDHFAHVLRVWMVGVYVIYECKNRIRPPDIHPAINVASFETSELFSAFTIAALCHDLGYPIEKTSKINDKISEMFGTFGGLDWSRLNYNFTPQRHELGKLLVEYLSGAAHFNDDRGNDEPLESAALKGALENMVSEYAEPTARTVKELSEIQESALRTRVRIGIRSQHTYSRKYSDSLESVDHGILSAMILMRKVRYFKEGEFDNVPRNFLFEELRQFLLRREILRACASHTCRDVYYIHPLTIESLLFFCDELQEWGRPRFSDLKDMAPESLGALQVDLEEYSERRICWTIDAGSLDDEAGLKWCRGLARKFRNALAGPVNVMDSNGATFELCWKMCWRAEAGGAGDCTVTFRAGGVGNANGSEPYTFNFVDAGGKEKSLLDNLEAESLGFLS